MRRRSKIAAFSLAAVLTGSLLGSGPALAEVPASTVKRLHDATEDWATLARSSAEHGPLPRVSDARVRSIFAALEAPELRDETAYADTDMLRLVDMMGGLNGIFKQYIGAPGADGQPDPAHNEVFYQDEIATMMSVMLDVIAAEVRGSEAFMASLPPKEVTPIRIAGMKGFKEGYAQTLLGAVCVIGNPRYRPENTRMLSAALGRNGRWFAGRLPEPYAKAIRNAAHELIAHGGDPATIDALRRFATDARLERY